MKLHPTAIGNALGGAIAILFAICAIFAYTATDLVVSLAWSFVHVLDLTPLIPAQNQSFEFGRFALGWVSISAYVWIFGWLLGTIYNASVRGRETS